MKTKTITKSFACALACLFMLSNLSFADNGTGVITVTSIGGSCLGFTPAQGNGPDNWEVAQGGSYTMIITGVTECTEDAITVFIQSSNIGNFCFTATGSGGTYTGTFTVPSPACFTMPISYKCGADQPCNNENTYNGNGQSNNNKVHLRSSIFDGNCIKTGDDQDCGSSCNLSLEGTQTDVICHNGSDGAIDVTASGAQGNVTYLWNDGATTEDRSGLSAGTYTVTATDGESCTASLTKTITQPDEITVGETHLDVSSHGGSDGSIDITVTGGSGGYTYLWNDGATTEDRTGLPAGTYTVTVTDAHSCTSSGTVVVNEPSCPPCAPPETFTVDSISPVSALICWEDIPCSNGYRLGWAKQNSNNWQYRDIPAGEHCTTFTNNYPTVYKIKVLTICQDGGESSYSDDYIFHTYPSCLSPTGFFTDNIQSNKATAHWTPAPDASSQNLWYRQVGTSSFKRKNLSASASSTVMKNLLPLTSYEWKVRSNCSDNLRSVTGKFSGLQTFSTISARMELNESSASSLSIYPNPSSDGNFVIDLSVNSAIDHATITITNLVGQVVYEQVTTVTGGVLSQQVKFGEGMPTGTYVARIIAGESVYTSQLVYQP